MSRVLLALCALALAAAAPVGAASRNNPDELPAMRVQDLHFGDVLFHFYAGDEFEALTRLEAYEQWRLMPHHVADADLLAGGLYLELGMHNEAGNRFQQLLGDNIPVGVRNRAWFYLAKIWYERGYYDRSEQALGRIQGRLSADLDGERENVLVNVLMHQQRFDAAIQQLRDWSGAPDWMAYARFNLGVALVRAGRLDEADPILTAVGSLNSDSEELLTLRDKANLALGFAHLQADQPAPAKVALNRVRLNSPYATRAMLGAGWADVALGQYRDALTPWMALHDRNLLDAAVQESYLAVPYAFDKLKAEAQAAQYYEQALQSFSAESQRIDEAIQGIRNGHMLDDILGNDKDARYGWFWQLRALPDAPQSRYLYAVLADNDFQEGLKNYRDLAFMQGTLLRWDDSMDAFGAMIDTRERAYAERLPRTDALLASDKVAQLRAARAAAGARLSAVETGADLAALGSDSERAQWDQVTRMRQTLSEMPAGPERDAAADKLRLIRGVLYWNLAAQFKARSYDEERQLRELDRALNELEERWQRVQRARATVPSNTTAFGERIAALAERIKALRARLDDTAKQQNTYLENLAESQLQAQKDRLATYAVQSRFALADIYDRAADAKPAEAPTP
jgi:hypothetical protein